MNIGERIRNARIEKGYTQEELGNLIGVQKSAVAKYEKGRVVNIKRSVLAKISKVLEIPPVELVSDVYENPIQAANELSEIFLDTELREMISEYKELGEKDKAQVREFIRFLKGRN